MAEEAIRFGEAADAVCTLCETALGHLLSTDGRGVTEEIVSGIFSKFCVGK
jgi:tRNA U34 5-carboxymethylaminomethyl modifying GTPase MnmE/TrmE